MSEDEYRKIDTVWKRDKDRKMVIIPGEYSDDAVKNTRLFSFTEKVDGQCITVITTKNDIKVIGKTHNTEFNKAHEKLLNYINDRFTRENIDSIIDWNMADKVVFYGEGYGAKIQKGGTYLSEDQKFILFDVVIDGIWLEESKVTDFAWKLGVDRVPVLGIGTVQDVIDLIIKRSMSKLAPERVMEGVVGRAHPIVLDRFRQTPIMFKIKMKDYEQLERMSNE